MFVDVMFVLDLFILLSTCHTDYWGVAITSRKYAFADAFADAYADAYAYHST